VIGVHVFVNTTAAEFNPDAVWTRVLQASGRQSLSGHFIQDQYGRGTILHSPLVGKCQCPGYRLANRQRDGGVQGCGGGGHYEATIDGILPALTASGSATETFAGYGKCFAGGGGRIELGGLIVSRDSQCVATGGTVGGTVVYFSRMRYSRRW